MTSWIYFVRKSFAVRLRALTSVPHALSHEAPNSWIMRAAATQGCSHKELASYLGFDFGHDFDYLYYYAFAKESPYVQEVRELESGRMFFGGKNQRGYQLRGAQGRRGRYRFCSLCLRDDQTPCFHLYCKMEQLVFRPWHRCLLEDRCPHCGKYVELARDMMEPGKGKHGVEDLSWCLMCCQPLHRIDPIFVDAQFLWGLPYWLRTWGNHGPTPVEGPGAEAQYVAAERERLLAAKKNRDFASSVGVHLAPSSQPFWMVGNWQAGPCTPLSLRPRPEKGIDARTNSTGTVT